jgi:very-short-patch-repair endonuclease
MEEKVFKPIAKFNGFSHVNRRGETEYIYPTVKWDELRLRDNTPKLQAASQANQQGILSDRTFLEHYLDESMDVEVENKRSEDMSMMLASPNLGLAAGEVSGGGYGGAPSMPPEMGGGMPPAAGPPTEAPPGGPPEGGGEAPPPGGPTADVLYDNYRTAFADYKELEAVVQKTAQVDHSLNVFASLYEDAGMTEDLYLPPPVDGTAYRGPLPEEMDMMAVLAGVGPRWGLPGQKLTDWLREGGRLESLGSARAAKWNALLTESDPMVRTAGKPEQKGKPQGWAWTSLEKKLYDLIKAQRFPFETWAQFLINGDAQYVADAAIPSLRIAIEADGETWHANPDKIESDRQRDSQLASQGWIVLRFTEDELEQRGNEVVQVINNAITARQRAAGNQVSAEAEPEMVREGS